MSQALENSDHVMEMMRGFDTGMLVSRSDERQLRARPMAIAKLAENGDFWFVTGRHSGKVHEMIRNPEMAVTLQNANQFISLSGKAKLVEDRQRVHELWSEAWKVWFPEGKDDPEITLIHFVPDEVEYWDNAGTRGLRYLFKAGIAYIQGETPSLDEGIHAKLKT